MHTVNCAVCGSSRKRTLVDQSFVDDYINLVNPDYHKTPRRFVVCEDCGLVYHDPQLDQKDLDVLYDKFRDSGFRNETPDEYFARITGLPKDQSENHQKVTWLRQKYPAHFAKPGAMLDIGCGGGVLIHTFLELNAGWKAAGVEPTPAFAELARRKLGMPIVTGNYKPGLFPGGKFDLVTATQVIEHVPDPVAFLRDIRTTELATEGLLYLDCPHVSDFGYLPHDHDRFRMQHLWYFSETSLTNVCRLAGYDVVTVERQRTLRDRNNILLVAKAAKPGRKPEIAREPVEAVLAAKTAVS